RAVDLDRQQVTTLVGTSAQASRYPPEPGVAPDVALASPWDLALDGDALYIAMTGSHQIWRMDLRSGRVEPFAGSGQEGVQDGPRLQATLAQPSGLALGDGVLYFVDSESSTVRQVSLAEDGVVTTLAGPIWDIFTFGTDDGVGRDARFQHPLGVTRGEDGALLIADTYNNRVRRVDPRTGETSTLFGAEAGWRDGSEPLFFEPGGLDFADGKLYVADTNNHAVRVVDLVTGETQTLVLKGIQRFLAGPGDASFDGQVLRLEPQTVGSGPGEVILDVILPAGYKINEQAPSSMTWQVTGGVVALEPDANRALINPHFPLHIAATFQPGAGVLTADLSLVYCEAVRDSLCLLDQVRLEAPLTVIDGVAPKAVLGYAIAGQ
ncbi:MAG: hypothetical protein D6790_08695, partial [Caldilineae bacterium]